MGQRVMFQVAGPPVRWQRPEQGRHPVTGRPVRFSAPEATAGKRAIAIAARAAWRGPPATGPVVLRVVAIFAIPPSWPKPVREAALRAEVMHACDPDLDQLVKLAQDALVGIAYMDDNQVCGYPNPAKRYGQPERTEITVEALDQTDAQKPPYQRRLDKLIAKHGVAYVLALKSGELNRSKSKRRDP